MNIDENMRNKRQIQVKLRGYTYVMIHILTFNCHIVETWYHIKQHNPKCFLSKE